ncbi:MULTISPECIES: hypothetical protein [Mesorhizobium]|uniref:hypothetical protein n=1 Tax=Mesorhizobium TaxID=68287 RepID=UPI0012EB9A59|nr:MULTISPECIES: hypothetical protein [Mesorhizobium]WJI36902.1 hypothetical protein NL534_23870 [Mesorhizobium opportunistum]
MTSWPAPEERLLPAHDLPSRPARTTGLALPAGSVAFSKNTAAVARRIVIRTLVFIDEQIISPHERHQFPTSESLSNALELLMKQPRIYSSRHCKDQSVGI